jgi:hypothetical protein
MNSERIECDPDASGLRVARRRETPTQPGAARTERNSRRPAHRNPDGSLDPTDRSELDAGPLSFSPWDHHRIVSGGDPVASHHPASHTGPRRPMRFARQPRRALACVIGVGSGRRFNGAHRSAYSPGQPCSPVGPACSRPVHAQVSPRPTFALSQPPLDPGPRRARPRACTKLARKHGARAGVVLILDVFPLLESSHTRSRGSQSPKPPAGGRRSLSTRCRCRSRPGSVT